MKAKQLLHDLRSAIDNCELHADDCEYLRPILNRIDAFFEPGSDSRIMNICKEFDIELSELTGRSRKRKLVYIRAAIADLLYNDKFSINQISKILNRERSTIYNCFKTVEYHYLNESDVTEIYERTADAFYLNPGNQ